MGNEREEVEELVEPEIWLRCEDGFKVDLFEKFDAEAAIAPGLLASWVIVRPRTLRCRVNPNSNPTQLCSFVRSVASPASFASPADGRDRSQHGQP